MLTNATYLKGLVIRATDGELGTVEQLFFDDETWAIRYLIVDTGGWLSGRRVLISPLAIDHVDWPARRLDVALTKRQVESSPDIDARQPVSRQHETAYSKYYGYSNYWGSFAPYAAGMAIPIPPTEAMADRIPKAPVDSHLRSTDAVTSYRVEATDGEIGHIAGFVVDEDSWAIRYLEVATQNWWPGKKVLLSPAWIEQVSWKDSKVYVSLRRDIIKDAPVYVESMPITRQYEDRLYATYGRTPYWQQKAERKSALSASGR